MPALVEGVNGRKYRQKTEDLALTIWGYITLCSASGGASLRQIQGHIRVKRNEELSSRQFQACKRYIKDEISEEPWIYVAETNRYTAEYTSVQFSRWNVLHSKSQISQIRNDLEEIRRHLKKNPHEVEKYSDITKVKETQLRAAEIELMESEITHSEEKALAKLAA